MFSFMVLGSMKIKYTVIEPTFPKNYNGFYQMSPKDIKEKFSRDIFEVYASRSTTRGCPL